jgi:hypothetical protein
VHTELTTLVSDLEVYKDELKILVNKADEDLTKYAYIIFKFCI